VEKTPPLPSISCNGNGIGFSSSPWPLLSPKLGEALSAPTGGWEREVEEADEVLDELPAGSAAEAVQASAEAQANEVIRI